MSYNVVMGPRILILSVGAALLSCSQPHSGPSVEDGKVVLSYHEVKTAEDLEIAARYASTYYNGPSSAGFGSLAEARNSEEYGKPEGVQSPFVFRLPFKRFERPVDIAISHESQNRPIQMWADFNFDESFSSNEELKSLKFGERTVFGPLRTHGRDGVPVCYVEYGLSILFIPTEWMEGSIQSGGVKNVIAAFDTDYDGTFNGARDYFGPSDHLVVGEYKGDPALWLYRDVWRSDESEVRQLLDRSFWNVSVARDGKTASFSRLETPGTLEVSGARAVLFGHSLPPNCITTGGRPLPMPVGSYDWLQINTTLIDKQGQSWRFEYFDGEGASYSVNAGTVTTIEVGPPVRATSTVEGAGDTGVFYQANLYDANDHLIMHVFSPDGERVVPKLVITNKLGSVVESPGWIDTTSVSYGGGDHGKKDAPLTFTITWDFGAFGNVSSVAVLN